MKLKDIKTPISSIHGIGPQQEKFLAKLNIFTVSDLLSFYPKSYDDRTEKISISDFEKHKKVHAICAVQAHQWFGYGKMKTLKLIINDGTGSASLICFNRNFYEKSLPVGSIICVTGTFEVKFGQIQSTSFEITKLSDSAPLSDFKNTPLPDSAVIPVYKLTEGLTQKNIRKAVSNAIFQYAKLLENELPEEIIIKRHLLQKKDAIKAIHNPISLKNAEDARYSLIFEELFNFQSVILERTFKHKGFIPQLSIDYSSDSSENNRIKNNFDLNEFEKNLSPLQKKLIERLPFKLTEDQMFAIFQMNNEIDRGYKERSKILSDNIILKQPFTMSRLLQGDVGSGKTLVSFFVALRVINWKGQCALMAPTEILAKQHAENAANLLSPLGIKIAYLTGNVKQKGRNMLLSELKNGNIDFIIGTHALFSKQIIYNDLQLAIIDEQHRFGVVQRESIIAKGRTVSDKNINLEPHLLMMSATPIPQSLALTVFGDLDISVVKSMPEGRLPVKTHLIKEENEWKAFEAVRSELKRGHQAYFVYPAIDSEDFNTELKSAEIEFQKLKNEIFSEFKCGLIHSKLPQEEQEETLKKFSNNQIQVLLATTVIEVGLDVPSATCIVIEQADRFGLAQLHQLRGRVGRGKLQSYCFLIYSDKITKTGIERMKILYETTDGFIIANNDLKLRGPGEITGTVQAGLLSLGLSDIVRDKEILLKAREDAIIFMQNKLEQNKGTSNAFTKTS
ncbi:MAG: ATP-dependent DNA helicase RecG [Spirochaetia bacterium]|nr:ATP-dependent DNA helicase RecG [Spirochaetia bacterium]